MKKYCRNLKEAKCQYKEVTGRNYPNENTQGVQIFKLKIKKTPTRNYFVGTFIEWLNL